MKEFVTRFNVEFGDCLSSAYRTPIRRPRTQASYPVQWQVQVPGQVYTVRAAFEAQELDSRNSTGAVYWEGLCELLNAQQQRVGRGYLEMTGYAAPLKL